MPVKFIGLPSHLFVLLLIVCWEMKLIFSSINYVTFVCKVEETFQFSDELDIKSLSVICGPAGHSSLCAWITH